MTVVLANIKIYIQNHPCFRDEKRLMIVNKQISPIILLIFTVLIGKNGGMKGINYRSIVSINR